MVETTDIKIKALDWLAPTEKYPWYCANVPWGTYYVQWDVEVEAWFASLEMGEMDTPILIEPLDTAELQVAMAAAQNHFEAWVKKTIEAPTGRGDAEMFSALRRTLTHKADQAGLMSRARHVKRGTTYEVLGKAKVQAAAPITEDADVVVYMSEDDGTLWVRPTSEFLDGRFLAVTPEDAPGEGVPKEPTTEDLKAAIQDATQTLAWCARRMPSKSMQTLVTKWAEEIARMDEAAAPHTYRPSMDPNDQGACVTCGGSPGAHETGNDNTIMEENNK